MDKIKPYLAFIIPIVLILVFLFAFKESTKSEEDFEFGYDKNNPLTSDTKTVTTTPATTLPSIEPTKDADQNSLYNKDNMNIDINKKHFVVLETTEGKIKVELAFKDTPKTADNFWTLSQKGFYNNTIFHRVIDGFMIQGGDPKGDRTGGPGYKFDDEPFNGEYTRGTVAMSNSGPNTNGSQFFIMHKDYPLPKNYIIFGHVVEGLDVVDKIASAQVTMNSFGEQSKPVNPVKILKTSLVEE